MVILVFVDDPLIIGTNPNQLNRTRDDPHTRFKMKDLGEQKFFLGIEFQVHGRNCNKSEEVCHGIDL